MSRPTYDAGQLIALYLSGLSQEEVGRCVGIAQTSVGDALRRHGIEARGRAKRRYALREDYFEKISTPEQAYWLGFLAADGYVIINNGLSVGIGVNLGMSDATHLKLLAASVGSDSPVRSIGGGSAATLRLFSMKLARDAAALGIVPNKSHNCTPWEAPEELAPHYWRGAMDGDGHVSPMRTGYAAFVGTRPMCEAFLKFAQHVCGTNAKPRRAYTGGPAWTAMVTGRRQVHALLTALYGSGEISLARKQIVASEFIAEPYRARSRPICKSPNCGGRSIAHLLCSKHYQQWRKSEESGRPRCSRDRCPAMAEALGLCGTHYAERRRLAKRNPTTSP